MEVSWRGESTKDVGNAGVAINAKREDKEGLSSLIACENIRFSTLFAAGDVPPCETSQRRRARRNGCFRRLPLLMQNENRF